MAKNRRMEKGRQPLIIGYWLPVIIWMTTIFVFSSQHSVKVSPEYWLNFAFFKMLHMIEYAVLFVLLHRPIKNRLHVFILTILYALSDEIHQSFVITREPAIRDVIIDAIGAGLVWYYLTKQLPKAPKPLKEWARRLDIPFPG